MNNHRKHPIRWIVALAILYPVTGWLGHHFTALDAQSTLVWPPSGLSLAAVILAGSRIWPGIWIGAFASALEPEAPLWATATVATGSTLAPLLGAAWLRRVADFDPAFPRPRDVLAFLGLAVVAATTVSATVGTVALVAAGVIEGATIAPTWITWWLGDANGVLMVAPVLLTWGVAQPIRSSARPGPIETAALLGLLFAAATLALAAEPAPTGEYMAVVALPLPALVWTALRLGPRGTATGLLGAWIIAVLATVQDLGPFAESAPERALPMLLLYMAMISTTAMTLTANLVQLEATRVSLERAESTATHAADFVRSVLDSLPDRVVVVNRNGDIIAVNQRWRRSAQHRHKAGQGGVGSNYLASSEAHLGEATPEVTTALHELLEGSRQEYRCEYSCPEPEQEDRWSALTIVRCELEGVRHAILVHQDITARKLAEHQQALAQEELDHRVKNNLAMVLGLAEHTAGTTATVEAFLASFQDRLRSLATTHEMLAARRWVGITVSEVVHAATTGLAEGRDRRFDLEGEPTFLPAPLALPLALALNELTTNALKHGALSTSEGRVHVSWRTSSTGELHIRWREHGGPPVSDPDRNGLGLQLVEDLVTSQLLGELQVERPETGLDVLLRICFGKDGRPLRPVTADADISTAPEPKPETGEVRMLVVEDDVLQARMLTHMLTRLGFRVVGPATDLEAARALVAREQIDGAVLDINIAGERSEAFAEELLDAGRPVLFVTGYAEPIGLSERLSAVPRITKPIESDALSRTLEEKLGFSTG